ncbi:F-box only protein 39-like isoform X2 [Neodiprion virginianus]|uniref:F-box only protein 39-like isoform X2 n=1 Tax=Neodiprion virginianus TaxID=2961670 RepID=UPI001EE6A124|nr:F-box only protein 39-like isoform X2 [Neodiprion virginianus]
MWDQLPELILTEIFRHLNSRDRANLGEVCKSWKHAMSSPILWRSVTILIDRDLRGELPLAKELAVKYGQHMRRLELAWSRPYVIPRETRFARNIQSEAGADFLDVIRTKDVQLKELILADWVFSCKWGNRGKLLCALANFLGYQHNLETLNLLNANLGVSDVLRILGSAVRASGNCLESLDLRGAFREWQAPHSNPRYLRLLGRLRALATLKLDYPALSDGALNALASAVPLALRTLHISVRDSDSRQHTIANTAWHELAVACPKLTVSYTIAEVMLQLRNNRELLDDLLVSLLVHCKQLTQLQYDGVLRSLDTLRDICELQTASKTCFQRIHVKPRNVSSHNRAILDDIGYQYDHKMVQQGVDFCIEDPASVLIFH